MQPPGKAFHLLIGALIVGAYYLGLPSHLWDQPPQARLSAEGWRPTGGQLVWHLEPVGRLPAQSLLPPVSAGPDGTLRLSWQDAGEQVAAQRRPSMAWESERVSRPTGAAASAVQWLAGIAPEPLLLTNMLVDRQGQAQPLAPWPPSSLLAGRALSLDDGSRLVPLVRQDRLELLHLNREGRPMAQTGVARVESASVPALFADTPAELFLFQATVGGARLFQGVQAGRHWRELTVDWPAPPQALLRRAEQQWWLLASDPRGQAQLQLFESEDRGATWRVLAEPRLSLPSADGNCAPALDALMDPLGLLQVFYLAGDCRLWQASLIPGEPS